MAKMTEKLFEADTHTGAKGPVECLGVSFPSDDARRQFFMDKLREKLKDPAFRKIEGFPIGEDEDILALSDPPYYTACPNPFFDDFVTFYGKPYDTKEPTYHQEPFSADVTEGKNDPIYLAHSYHTKVPHKAIMRYILHYTKPGDIVLDGFCGTGMTGVAAQLCGDRATIESLGYSIKADGSVHDADGKCVSHFGPRRAILSDLAPIASFIAYNYTTPINGESYARQVSHLLEVIEQECHDNYLTSHPATGSRPVQGTIRYTIWSDVFNCPQCGGDIVFWDVAVDQVTESVRETFSCPHCAAELTKQRLDRQLSTHLDPYLKEPVKQMRSVAVQHIYAVGKKNHKKRPDSTDLRLLADLESNAAPDWITTARMPEGSESRRNDRYGLTHVHHFFTGRDLRVIGKALSHIREGKQSPERSLLLLGVTSLLNYSSKLCRWRSANKSGPLSGTLYVSSTTMPLDAYTILPNRLKRMGEAKLSLGSQERGSVIIQCASSTRLPLPNNSVDYLFVDPPFGGNLMYSQLSFIWESWLRLLTSTTFEAVEGDAHHKSLLEYQRLMEKCFSEFCRVLKPGRWMTVEFHNSKNSVWNAIQEALQHAGFVVADVRTLDRKQGSFKQVSSAGAVKQDLIISTYKPDGAFERKFSLEGGTEEGAWDFVRHHLRQVPVFVAKGQRVEVVAERQKHLLFDRMVAFHVQRGVSVPISAAEFHAGLIQKFPERDGMYFLPDQAPNYDRQRMSKKEIEQLQLFVNDEKTAIQWVRRQLTEQPMSYQDLSPLYMKEAQRVWEKHEQPLELLTILEQNFVKDPDNTWRLPDLKRESDLEQIRHQALLKEFQQYLETKAKLKIVRTEALRAGFKDCWQKKDYVTIVEMAKRVPEAVIQEDPALLMYFDNASLLKGE